MAALVREAVLYGNVQELGTDVLYNDILEALALESTVTERMMVTYEYVCQKLAQHKHYYQQKHILGYHPEFRYIAEKYFSNWKLRLYKHQRNSPTIDTIICPAELPARTTLSRYMLRDRSLKYFGNNVINIEADNVLWITFSETLLPEIANRLQFLSTHAPHYAQHLAPKYNLIMKHGERQHLTDDQWATLHKFYPQHFDDLTDLSELARRIARYPLAVQAYYLALPIDSVTYQRAQLRPWLEKLSEVGPEAYLQLPEVLNFKPWYSLGITPTNERNFLHESVKDFSPADVFLCSEGRLSYVFTRSEVEQLLKSKVNHWSTRNLDIHMVNLIHLRMRFVEVVQLPVCQPLSDAYQEILNVQRKEAGKYVPVSDSYQESQFRFSVNFLHKRRRLDELMGGVSSTPISLSDELEAIPYLEPGAVPSVVRRPGTRVMRFSGWSNVEEIADD